MREGDRCKIQLQLRMQLPSASQFQLFDKPLWIRVAGGHARRALREFLETHPKDCRRIRHFLRELLAAGYWDGLCRAGPASMGHGAPPGCAKANASWARVFRLKGRRWEGKTATMMMVRERQEWGRGFAGRQGVEERMCGKRVERQGYGYAAGDRDMRLLSVEP